MTLLVNNGEGGSSGSTVTTGNSGGSSGTAFDAVSIGSGDTLAYDNVHATHGSTSFKCVTGVSANTDFVSWTTSIGTNTTVWFRMYLFITPLPSSTVQLFSAYSSGVLCGSIALNSSGKLLLQDSSSATINTFTTSIATGTWFRIEGFITGSASAGQIECKLFKGTLGDLPIASAPTETQTTGTTVNTSGSPDDVRYGITNAVASTTFWMDDLGVSNVGYIGPVWTATSDASAASVSSAIATIGLANITASDTGGTYVTQDFEETASGTTISAANTAPTAGFPLETAFNSVTLSAGTTATFDNSRSAHQAQSALLNTGASSGTIKLTFTSPYATAAQSFRFYAFYPAYPPGASSNFLFLSTSGGAICGRFHINNNGQLAIDTTGGNNLATTSTSVPLNKWVRIEGWVIGNASTGQASLSLYTDMDSATPAETITTATTNTAGIPNQYQFGATNAGNLNFAFSFDDIAVAIGTGPIGPSYGLEAVQVGNQDADTGSGAEAAQVAIVTGESWTGVDSATVAVKAAGETGSGAGSAIVAAGLPGSDAGSGTESAVVGQQARSGDGGGGFLSPNPSFAGALASPWAAIGGTLTATMAPPAGGPAPSAGVLTGADNSTPQARSGAFAVTEGLTYPVGADLWIANQADMTIRVGVSWQNASGTEVAFHTNWTGSLTPSAWNHAVFAEACPAGLSVVKAQVYYAINFAVAGNPLYLSNAGVTGDVALVRAGTPAADSGSGAEGSGLRASVADGDTGSGLELATVGLVIPVDDPGSGDDSATVSATVRAVDSGTGSGSVDLQALLTDDDTGDWAGFARVSIALPGTDSGDWAESARVEVDLADDDTGSWDELASVAVIAGDDLLGEELALTGARITAEDSGAGASLASVIEFILASDTGAAAEFAAIDARIRAGDTASAVEDESIGLGVNSGLLVMFRRRR